MNFFANMLQLKFHKTKPLKIKEKGFRAAGVCRGKGKIKRQFCGQMLCTAPIPAKKTRWNAGFFYGIRIFIYAF
jgi:hypothetical protein